MSGTGSKRLHAGFTLLELLVVLGIMLMTATVFPLVLDRALPGRRVTIATAHLVTIIRDAQARSMTQGRPISVPLETLTAPLSSSTHVSFTDWTGRPLTALFLYPDGSATGGRLRVVDGSHGSTLLVSAVTGNVRTDRH